MSCTANLAETAFAAGVASEAQRWAVLIRVCVCCPRLPNGIEMS